MMQATSHLGLDPSGQQSLLSHEDYAQHHISLLDGQDDPVDYRSSGLFQMRKDDERTGNILEDFREMFKDITSSDASVLASRHSYIHSTADDPLTPFSRISELVAAVPLPFPPNRLKMYHNVNPYSDVDLHSKMPTLSFDKPPELLTPRSSTMNMSSSLGEDSKPQLSNSLHHRSSLKFKKSLGPRYS